MIQGEATLSKKRGRPKKVAVQEPDEYEVEKIMAMRVNADGSVQYLIKWLGWSEEHNTWQHPDDLDCPEILEIFKQELADDPSLNHTPDCLKFPPPPSQPDVWAELVESVTGLRERIEENGERKLLVRISWVNGFETEELLEDCRKAAPRPVLDYLISKLKFKTAED